MYDVMIVGAGPGGAFTAKLLAKAGYDVILIEKETIPRDKPCAGWITPKVLEILKISPSKLDCVQPVNGLVIWLPSKNQLVPYPVKYNKPISYGIRRIEFDTLIINEAKDAGAEVVDSSFVTNVYRQKKAVFVQAKNNQEFKGRFIVGADGTHSTVAKDLWLRRKWKPSELNQCIESETELGTITKDLTDYYGFAEIFLNFKTDGFAWYFPKNNFLNIGLGIRMSKITPDCNAKSLYNELLQNLNQINHLQGVKLAPVKGHSYPAYHGPYHYPTYGDRVLLIGDAGGFPINYTGEGIRTALLTGKFAAETLIEALEEDFKVLKAYYVKWTRALRDEYIVGDLMQMLYSPLYFDLIKSVFIEEKRFRKLFIDLFFNLKTPRQAMQQLLVYSPLLYFRFLKYNVQSLIKDFSNFLNV